MSTNDYKRGLKGSQPDIFDFGSDRKDVERGYRDHLRNQELANTIRGQSDSSPTVSGGDYGMGFGGWLALISVLVTTFGGMALGYQLFGEVGAIIFGILGFVLCPYIMLFFFLALLVLILAYFRII